MTDARLIEGGDIWNRYKDAEERFILSKSNPDLTVDEAKLLANYYIAAATCLKQWLELNIQYAKSGL